MMKQVAVFLVAICLLACTEPAPPTQASAASLPPAETRTDSDVSPESAFDGIATALPILETQELADHDAVWEPAPTPQGGVSWELLESTQETTRMGDDGYIRSKPIFPAGVKALEGRRITVAGWMMPLENGARQNRFVLLAYPPGCPFHFHALPNQFIEVNASRPVRLDEQNVTIVTGVLELTGYDESGIYYKLREARAVDS